MKEIFVVYRDPKPNLSMSNKKHYKYPYLLKELVIYHPELVLILGFESRIKKIYIISDLRTRKSLNPQLFTQQGPFKETGHFQLVSTGK